MDDNKHPNSDGFYKVGEDMFNAVDTLFNPTRASASNHIYEMQWYFTRNASWEQ